MQKFDSIGVQVEPVVNSIGVQVRPDKKNVRLQVRVNTSTPQLFHSSLSIQYLQPS